MSDPADLMVNQFLDYADWLGSKLLNALLFPFAELASWLVMRDLRRWAKSPQPFGA